MNYNHDVFTVVEFQHVKPGKGPAFVRTKLKSLTSGKVIDNTWPSGHKIDEVRIERRKFQYLYKDDMGFHFMNSETFEQVSIPENLIENNDLMVDGMNVEALFNANTEEILTCELPSFVILEVSYSEPGVKGDTATNATKPATLQTGAAINVPLFVNEGDKIKVDTKTRAYMERAK
jgi:elongation factor P|tara:strand:- start:235 stop:762 length:528 start_codon:yes stop_codon:yes gene_type:complete